MADEYYLEVVWSQTMERRGETAFRLNTYIGQSSLTDAVQKGSTLVHGDNAALRTGRSVKMRGNQNAVSPDVVKGTNVPREAIRHLVETTTLTSMEIAGHFDVSRSVVDREAKLYRPAHLRKRGKRKKRATNSDLFRQAWEQAS